MTYLLDANVLIDASNSYYSFDICPGFWEALSQVKSVISIDKVKDEIVEVKKEMVRVEGKVEEIKDRLAEWAKKDVQKSFFVSTNDNNKVISAQEYIAEHIWGLPKHTTKANKEDFLKGADS